MKCSAHGSRLALWPLPLRGEVDYQNCWLAILAPSAIAESLALARDPILFEKELEVDKAKEKLRDVNLGAILPKFEVSMGMGPAPGLHLVPDYSLVTTGGDTVKQTQKE